MMLSVHGGKTGGVATFRCVVAAIWLLPSIATAQEAAAQESATPKAETVEVTSPEAATLEAATTPADASSVTAQVAATQHLILIIGAPGEERFAAEFSRWGDRLEKAAAVSGVSCTVIGLTAPQDKPAPTDSTTSAAIASASTGEPVAGAAIETGAASKSSSGTDLQKILEALNQHGTIATTEPLWVIYLGHGTFNRKSAALALRGPDLTDQQMAKACENMARPLAVVLCSSCSSPFVNALSGPGRVIVTATKDGNQIQYSRFGDAFSEGITGLDADANRDGQTSLLEAWLWASRRTEEFYKTEGRLATEHALLEDNGDAKGVKADIFVGDRPAPNVKSDAPIDGALAARLFFVRSEEERRLTPDQRVTRDALEAQLEELKRRRDSMDEASYLQELEALLLPLAELYRDTKAQSP